MPERSVRDDREIADDASGSVAGDSRKSGALPRPFSRCADSPRRVDAADRSSRRDFLPAEYVLERRPGAAPGGVRRPGLAERSHRVDLVHQYREFPEIEIDRASDFERRLDGLDPQARAAAG